MTSTLPALAAILAAAPAAAGLYDSAEKHNPPPSQWRGFLLDHRALRMAAAEPRPDVPAAAIRREYRDRATALSKKERLTAGEAADLGAAYVRLGELDKAVEVLRAAARRHPDDFRVAANLGTAWQLRGDLARAERSLAQAVRLAPGESRPVEELHLRLVRSRRRDPDALFDPGKATNELAGRMQRLALALPADGLLLWSLGKLAHDLGEVRTAAAILDGCVTEFGLSSLAARRMRRQYRAEADKLPAGRGADGATKFRPKSRRPLARSFDLSRLPKIRPDGLNLLPWAVLAETKLGRKFKPDFPEYLEKLDGKAVAMTGFMQPLGRELEVTLFLFIEYPIGCWFCEAPEPTGMVLAELPVGKSMLLKRGLIKVEGTLRLNRTDPEDLLFTLEGTRVGEVD